MIYTKVREVIKSRLQSYSDIRCSFLIEKVVTTDRLDEEFIDDFTTKLLDISIEEVKNFVGEEDFYSDEFGRYLQHLSNRAKIK